MSKRTVPTRIVRMISSRLNKGHSATKIANAVNGSATARNLKVKLSTRSVAAIMANLTRGNYSDL